MKQRKIKKNVIALLLAVAMIVTSFPVFSHEVHAAGNQLPTKEQFATVDELKSFNTNDNDGTKNPAKVYFGNNNQQWWIAGSQNGNATLFAASPLATSVKFNQNRNEKEYNGQRVYSNHYGASDIKKTVKEMETSTSYFTGAEQSLMNDTTIYTNDTIDNSVYSTMDKLYLAYGDSNDNKYITVGTNNQNSLNDGLRIDMSYWGNSHFWLRAPYMTYNYYAQYVQIGQFVFTDEINAGYTLVPAFELNLSSVIFASAAPAALSNGDLTLQDTDGDGAFTLRYKADNLGSALVSYDKSKVILNDVQSGTYLVVQNSAGAKAIQITSETEVLATDMGLDSFANCKVWLETTNTDERMTYATLATLEQGYSVNITASDGLVVTNGVQGVGQGSTITDITVEVNDGYYLPDGYTDTIQGLNGLDVENVTQYGFTISGTPTSDVNIILPAAKRENFVVEGGIKGVDYTYRNGILTFVKGGQYVVKHPEGVKDTSDRIVIPENFVGQLTLDNLSINLNTFPCIKVASNADLTLMIKGVNNLGVHQDNAAAIQFVNATDNGRLVIDSVEPEGRLNLHGRNGTGLGSPGYSSDPVRNIYINGGIIDVSSDGCYFNDVHKIIGMGSYETSSPSEITINGGTITGSNIGSLAADSKVIVKDGNIKNNLIGEAVIDGGYIQGRVDDTQIENSAGQTVYRANVRLESSDIKSLKVDGSHYLFPTDLNIKEIPMYLSLGEHTITHEDSNGNINEFDIIVENNGHVKYVNFWTQTLSIEGWAYGQPANSPSASAKYGDVIFTYSEKVNGPYTSNVPNEAGTWYVKASVEGTNEYTNLEEITSFGISQANSSIKFKDGILLDKAYDTKAVVLTDEHVEKTGSTGKVTFTFEKKVNDQWEMVDEAVEVGTYRVTATLAEDSNHISATSNPLEFTIHKADSNVTITTSSLDKVYDGYEVNAPEYTTTGSNGQVTIKWQEKSTTTRTEWKDLNKAPSNAGTYRVVVELAGNDKYNPTSASLEFVISQATNTWLKELKIENWTYGEKAKDPSAEAQFGNVIYTYSKEENGTYTSEKPSEAGTWYVKASVEGTTNYTGLEAKAPFEIAKASSTIKFKDNLSLDKIYDTKAYDLSEKHVEKTGSTGKVTFTFEKKVNDEWEVVKEAVEVGTYRVTATLAEDTNYLPISSKPLEFTISKAASNVTITTSSLDKVYDGNEVNAPEYTTTGSNGQVTIKWQEKSMTSKSEWLDLDKAPSNAGSYRVVVELAGNDNYNPISASLEFEITQANNTWLEELKIENWTYGDEPNKPSAKAQFGDVIFTYSKEKDGTYTDEVPVNAGTYYVKASVEGTENYTDLEKIVSFEIAKAVPLYEEVTGLVLGQGQALSTIVLPENFKWVDDTMIGGKLGTHRFEAIYTPDDTDNYLTVNVEIEVEVVPVPEKLNHVPTIKADDQTITIGDEFDALKGVSATDYEDGELKVEVIKNTVNTSKVDEYEVTYKVVDSKGATVTKTIKVKVLEAIEDKEVLEDKIDEIVNKDDYTQESYEEYLEALEKAKDVLNNPNASKEEIQEALENLEAAMNKLQKVENTPETGDQTNIYLYTSMITLTSLLFVYLSLKKRKTNLSK